MIFKLRLFRFFKYIFASIFVQWNLYCMSSHIRESSNANSQLVSLYNKSTVIITGF